MICTCQKCFPRLGHRSRDTDWCKCKVTATPDQSLCAPVQSLCQLLSQLPTECQEHICMHLTYRDICNVRHTCKAAFLRHFVQCSPSNPFINTMLDTRKYDINPHFGVGKCKHCMKSISFGYSSCLKCNNYYKFLEGLGWAAEHYGFHDSSQIEYIEREYDFCRCYGRGSGFRSKVNKNNFER
jgi:hypothetical protein